jgi:hypothetical protein
LSVATRRSRGQALLWMSRVCIAAAAAAVLLSACAGSGYHYVKSSENHTYFKVPEGWKLYDEESLLKASKGTLSKDEIDQQRASGWITAFDANPKPSLHHLESAKTPYPTGEAIVQKLTASAADKVSLQSLRNLFFDIDGTQSGSPATVLSYEPVNLDGGFHGSHLVARITANKASVTVDQIAVIDEATTKVYALVVSCTTSCYSKHQSKIEKIISSWTVKDS